MVWTMKRLVAKKLEYELLEGFEQIQIGLSQFKNVNESLLNNSQRDYFNQINLRIATIVEVALDELLVELHECKGGN